ncbi:MAG: hypothetical protein ACYDGY_10860, partial [Acidimicrobiales bacterium]
MRVVVRNAIKITLVVIMAIVGIVFEMASAQTAEATVAMVPQPDTSMLPLYPSYVPAQNVSETIFNDYGAGNACGQGVAFGSNGGYSYTSATVQSFRSPSCVQALLAGLNAVMAGEGIGPVSLPSNWSQLTPAEHVFALIDLERAARGLAPFAGMTSTLDQYAQEGADPPGQPSGYWGDPTLPSNFSFGPGTALVAVPSSSDAGYFVDAWDTSVAAGNPPNSILADFGWVYSDGWGGSAANTFNVDCTGPTASGCWGHRNNILANYPAQATWVTATSSS